MMNSKRNRGDAALKHSDVSGRGWPEIRSRGHWKKEHTHHYRRPGDTLVPRGTLVRSPQESGRINGRKSEVVTRQGYGTTRKGPQQFMIGPLGVPA